MRQQSEIGKRVADARHARGWSVPELAREAGVVESTVYRLEEGTQPRYSTLERVAEALGMTVAQLTATDGPPARARQRHPGVEQLARDKRTRARLGVTDADIEYLRDMVLPDGYSIDLEAVAIMHWTVYRIGCDLAESDDTADE